MTRDLITDLDEKLPDKHHVKVVAIRRHLHRQWITEAYVLKASDTHICDILPKLSPTVDGRRLTTRKTNTIPGGIRHVASVVGKFDWRSIDVVALGRMYEGNYYKIFE